MVPTVPLLLRFLQVQITFIVKDKFPQRGIDFHRDLRRRESSALVLLEIVFGSRLIDSVFQSIETPIFIDVSLRERHFLETAKFLLIKPESLGESVNPVAVGADHILRNVITKRFPRPDFHITALNVMKEDVGVLLLILRGMQMSYEAQLQPFWLFPHWGR